MTLLHLAILLYLPFLCASVPIFNGTGIHSLNSSESPSNNNTRTLWDIILSCAVTLFACTWTAVHPNIPGMSEGKFSITLRRLGIMITALITPEFMILWAAKQFVSARVTAKEFNDAFGAQLAQTHGHHRDISESAAPLLGENIESDGRHSRRPNAAKLRGRTVIRRLFAWVNLCTPEPVEFRKWTVTHGFFAWMGGFILYIDDEPRATLTPDELLRFVLEGSVDMPDITEADIKDKSKGDVLSKGIAILQLVWFVVQLIARYVQNLPVTLLEIDTLAVTTLTCIAYGLWWKKPKDIGRPCIVHWKATAFPLPTGLTYEKTDSRFPHAGRLFRLALDLFSPFVSLSGVVSVFISRRAADSRRVPSLGGFSEHRGRITTFLFGCFGGVVFGGMHCLGWNFSFQRFAEQVLWRVVSLMLAFAPAYTFTVFAIDIFDWEGMLPWWMQRLRRIIQAERVMSFIGSFLFVLYVHCLGFLISSTYIYARVILLVLMMLSLRSLPPGVYDTVAWTKFIPHL